MLLRRAQLSPWLLGAPLAPLPALPCDNRLPSPLSTRASVTKGGVLAPSHKQPLLASYSCLIQQFLNYGPRGDFMQFTSIAVHCCPNFDLWPKLNNQPELFKNIEFGMILSAKIQPNWLPVQKQSSIWSNYPLSKARRFPRWKLKSQKINCCS